MRTRTEGSTASSGFSLFSRTISLWLTPADDLLPLLDVPGTARGPYNETVCSTIDMDLRVQVDSRLVHCALRDPFRLKLPPRGALSHYLLMTGYSLYGVKLITSTVTRNSAGLRERPSRIHSPNNYQSKNGPLEPASDPNPSGTLEHFGGRGRPRPTTNPC